MNFLLESIGCCFVLAFCVLLVVVFYSAVIALIGFLALVAFIGAAVGILIWIGMFFYALIFKE